MSIICTTCVVDIACLRKQRSDWSVWEGKFKGESRITWFYGKFPENHGCGGSFERHCSSSVGLGRVHTLDTTSRRDSMACHSTPKTKPQSLASSVFMTPPVSAERKNASPSTTPHPPAPSRPLPSMPPPFPTPVDTPNLPLRQKNCTPKLTLREGEDVLSGLHMGGYRLLVEQILHYLEPCDLCR